MSVRQFFSPTLTFALALALTLTLALALTLHSPCLGVKKLST
jgi:hypothetical protein